MSSANEMSVSVVCLDRIQLNALLLRLEDNFRNMRGESITSPEFYERYLRGEFDETWAMAWATYYEAYLRKEKSLGSDDRAVEAVAESLPPVLV